MTCIIYREDWTWYLPSHFVEAKIFCFKCEPCTKSWWRLSLGFLRKDLMDNTRRRTNDNRRTTKPTHSYSLTEWPSGKSNLWMIAVVFAIWVCNDTLFIFSAVNRHVGFSVYMCNESNFVPPSTGSGYTGLLS